MPEWLRRAYSRLYYLFRSPPAADEIDSKLAAIESQPNFRTGTASDRCDCLVTAGDVVVACKQNIKRSVCLALGDQNPSLVVTPLPVGGCGNSQ